MNGKNIHWSIFLIIFLIELFAFSYFYFSHSFRAQPSPSVVEPLILNVNQPLKIIPAKRHFFDQLILEKIFRYKKQVSLLAVGDIMLSRDVASQIKKLNDYHYPFLKTVALTQTADLAFGNLETPITPGRQIKTGEMLFRSDPEVVQGLVYAGFDILSLANNHTPNFGQKGLLDTFNYLKSAGISYVGAGENLDSALAPVIKEVKGLKFAFLAFNDFNSVPKSYFATQTQPGTAPMDLDNLKNSIAQAKTQADFVIISLHSGTEYASSSNSRQQNFARLAIDAGAALVIGHHPHVVQNLEKYHNGYIFYSLGNFIFDQMWSAETRQGLAAEIIFNSSGLTNIKLHPIVIENYSQPRLASPEESQEILNRLSFDFQTEPAFSW